MDPTVLFELKGKGMAPMHLLRQQPSVLSDHGRHCNQQDTLNLALHTKASRSTHVAPNGAYTLLSITVPGAKNTVLLIAGGDQHPYCLDSESVNGFLIPGNLLDKWQQYNVNAILLIPPYLLDYGWGNVAGDRKNSHKIIEKVFKQPKAKIYNKNIFTKVLNFYQDLDFILNAMPQQQKMWVAGHCTSADALARYCAISSFIKPYGMIMWNPSWRHSKQSSSNVEKYFLSHGESRLLVVQHEQDIGPGVSPDIAKKIVEEYKFENKKLVLLNGGENKGLPCFSMGYHGFRGIEDQLVRVTAEFIKNSSN